MLLVCHQHHLPRPELLRLTVVPVSQFLCA